MARRPKDTLVPGTASAENATPSLVSGIGIIESLMEERAAVTASIKAEFDAIKSMGFDTKIVRKVIARRARDADDLANEEMLVALYEGALDLVEVKALLDSDPRTKGK